jgi:hypothetical protein
LVREVHRLVEPGEVEPPVGGFNPRQANSAQWMKSNPIRDALDIAFPLVLGPVLRVIIDAESGAFFREKLRFIRAGVGRDSKRKGEQGKGEFFHGIYGSGVGSCMAETSGADHGGRRGQ